MKIFKFWHIINWTSWEGMWAEPKENILSTMQDADAKLLTRSELEDLLINVDVHFIQHVSFHIESLRRDLNQTLKNFPEDESSE